MMQFNVILWDISIDIMKNFKWHSGHLKLHYWTIKKKLIQILESEGFQVSSDVVNSTTLEEVNKIVDKSKTFLYVIKIATN